MTLYEILGVKPDTTPEEIKAAWRSQSRKLHPDKNPNDPQATGKFQALEGAYRILSDPETREQYDLTGDTDPKNPESQAMEMIFDLFSRIVVEVDTMTEALSKLNEAINHVLTQVSQELVELQSKVNKLEKKKKALKFNGKGANLIGDALDHVLAQINERIGGLTRAREIARLAEKFLPDYEGLDKPVPRACTEEILPPQYRELFNNIFGQGFRR